MGTRNADAQISMSLFQETLGGLRKFFLPPSRGIVLALGGGGAAGLAHIGVLQTIAENNIPVRAIVGTSIGAEIGAFYATGMPLDELTSIAIAFDWKQTLRLFLPGLPVGGGLVSGVRITDFLRDRLGERRIEDLALGYIAMAADLDTGEQVVMDRGDLVEAVRASVSLPGLLAPLRLGGRTLVDGAVLNPLPFDVARQHFGGPVVAVATHAGARGVPTVPSVPQARQWLNRTRQLLDQPWIARAPALQAWLRAQLGNPGAARNAKTGWTARRVFDRAIDMTQAEIVRLRAAQQPPDILLTPVVGDIGILEFYRAKEAIAAGRRAAEEKLAEIRQLVGAVSSDGSATAANIHAGEQHRQE